MVTPSERSEARQRLNNTQKNGNDRTRLIVSILQNGFTISEASSVLRRIREQ